MRLTLTQGKTPSRSALPDEAVSRRDDQITIKRRKNNVPKETPPANLLRRLIWIFDDDVAVEPASGRPAALDFKASRLDDGHKVVQNSVRNSLIKDAFVTKSLQIHLQTLQLHADFVGHVRKNDRAIVGLASFRANRRKFRAVMLDREVTLTGRVVEDFENVSKLRGVGIH